MLFTTLCTGWILEKRTSFLFALKSKKTNEEQTVYISPNSRSTAPLRRLFMLCRKGGLCTAQVKSNLEYGVIKGDGRYSVLQMGIDKKLFKNYILMCFSMCAESL